MTDLDTIIRRLQAVREQHGNVTVWHHDCEWGLTPVEPGLCKVLSYTEGESPMHWTQESALAIKSQIEAHDIRQCEEDWKNHEVIQSLWDHDQEDYLVACKQNQAERIDFLRRFEMAPFSVVF